MAAATGAIPCLQRTSKLSSTIADLGMDRQRGRFSTAPCRMTLWSGLVVSDCSAEVWRATHHELVPCIARGLKVRTHLGFAPVGDLAVDASSWASRRHASIACRSCRHPIAG
jgi:hypothetical protein